MASNSVNSYDVFISYQWDVKESVRLLYTQLTKKHGLRCWMDDFKMGSGDKWKQVFFEYGIRNSSVVLCCITKKYTESKNCVREITFADQISKPLEIIMFERLEVGETAASDISSLQLSYTADFLCMERERVWCNFKLSYETSAAVYRFSY